MNAKSRLEALAHHEAGHAVAAVELKRAINYVTIIPENDSLGHCSFPDPKIDELRLVAWIEREVLIGLCGGAAEAKLIGRRNHRGAKGDYKDAVNLASDLFASDLVLEKWLDDMLARAEAFVAAPLCWVQIEALAAELLIHRRLGAKRVRAICRKAILAVSKNEEL